MGRAHARATRVDDYLNAPRSGRPDLRVVEGGAEPAFSPAAEPAPGLRALRPDWLPPDLELPDDLGTPAKRTADRQPAPRAARRTVVVAGRPNDAHLTAMAPRKRPSPTAARLAGRPDRIAGWAVLLGVVMAVMAGATAGNEQDTGPAAAPQAPAIGR